MMSLTRINLIRTFTDENGRSAVNDVGLGRMDARIGGIRDLDNKTGLVIWSRRIVLRTCGIRSNEKAFISYG